MSAIILAENVKRDFPSGRDIVHALKGISLEIEQGTLSILRGRSGSGKTTLINMLGALDYPTAGKVIFNGNEITRLPERKRDEVRRCQMGFVFQSVALISLMTAYENVEFGLRIAGCKARERRQRTIECLELVGLGKRMNHRPFELSGGEQQRVAIARAIAHRPKLIFADEPTAEVDTHMALTIVSIFRELVEKEGITVVMTTHDPSMMDIADHVITLEDGEITDERRNKTIHD